MPSWDLLDEDFDYANTPALDAVWTDGDNVNGVSEPQVYNSIPCLRLDANTAAADNYAKRSQDIGSIPDSFTLETKLYHPSLGTKANNDNCVLRVCQADERLHVTFDSIGAYIYDTDVGGWTEIGSGLVKITEYQIWRFVVTYGAVGDGICDVYLFDSTHNWEKVGSAIPCSEEAAYANGDVDLVQLGYTTNDVRTLIDYTKILTGHYAVYPEDLAICLDTSFVIQDGIRIDRASNGDVRAQILYDDDRKDFLLVHKAISEADKAILDAFYATNKALEFTLPWIDDVGYNCIFAPRPIKYTLRGGSRYDAVVSLVQKDE